ncbi:hypothetical protein PH586_03880 [Pseudomonas sp. SA3-5]|uniref:Uncharacterized protein n=1 Tax=Pseudomonas aestuarii TaxID=3018340 RepID=A0ABT4XBG3_9PSED|nr:hypothetical protein [Pseudomonas aestuarii]MDA7085530.1 hypothetical protein [Pseudomonas aestuarii]
MLNVAGSETFKPRLVTHKLQSAAMKIDNRLCLIAHRLNTVINIHYDAAFIDTHLVGLVAINSYRDVLSTTRNSLEMLDPADVFGKRFNAIDICRWLHRHSRLSPENQPAQWRCLLFQGLHRDHPWQPE